MRGRWWGLWYCCEYIISWRIGEEKKKKKKGGDIYVLGLCLELVWMVLVLKFDEGEEVFGGVVIVILYVLLVGECEFLVVM